MERGLRSHLWTERRRWECLRKVQVKYQKWCYCWSLWDQGRFCQRISHSCDWFHRKNDHNHGIRWVSSTSEKIPFLSRQKWQRFHVNQEFSIITVPRYCTSRFRKHSQVLFRDKQLKQRMQKTFERRDYALQLSRKDKNHILCQKEHSSRGWTVLWLQWKSFLRVPNRKF